MSYDTSVTEYPNCSILKTKSLCSWIRWAVDSLQLDVCLDFSLRVWKKGKKFLNWCQEKKLGNSKQLKNMTWFDKLPHTHSTSEEQSAHSLHSTPNCNVFIQKSMRYFLFRFPVFNPGLTPFNSDSLAQGLVCWFWRWEPTWVKAGFDFYIWNESKIQQKDVILLTHLENIIDCLLCTKYGKNLVLIEKASPYLQISCCFFGLVWFSQVARERDNIQSNMGRSM